MHVLSKYEALIIQKESKTNLSSENSQKMKFHRISGVPKLKC